MIATAPAPRAQQFLEGLWLGTEGGDVIELIAWAEPRRYLPWQMANGSLDDAPVLPRTYRILNSMPAWRAIAVVAATADAFAKDPRPTRNPAVAVQRSEADGQHGQRSASLNSRSGRTCCACARPSGPLPEKPLYFFLALNNGVVTRFYPFRIDRPAP